MAGIVPVVAHRRVLADVGVEQLVGGLGHQVGEDEVKEFGLVGGGGMRSRFMLSCISIYINLLPY